MSDRDIRQHQCIERWVHNKCKGCIEGCTGFGAPRGTIGYIFPVVRSNGAKFYYSNEYIPIEKGYAVPIEKSSELLSGNIGENPAKENPEINSEIAKGSESSYSVGGE